MPRVKQASKKKRTTKAAALKVLSAGLGLSLVGGASASTMPTAGVPQSDNTSPNQRSFSAKRKWPTSVSPRSISSIGKTLAAACSWPADAVVVGAAMVAAGAAAGVVAEAVAGSVVAVVAGLLAAEGAAVAGSVVAAAAAEAAGSA